MFEIYVVIYENITTLLINFFIFIDAIMDRSVEKIVA